MTEQTNKTTTMTDVVRTLRAEILRRETRRDRRADLAGHALEALIAHAFCERSDIEDPETVDRVARLSVLYADRTLHHLDASGRKDPVKPLRLVADEIGGGT